MKELNITLTEEQKAEVQKEFNITLEACALWLESYEMTKLVHNLVFTLENFNELLAYDRFLGCENLKNNEEYKRIKKRIYELNGIFFKFAPMENIYHPA